ncbi:PQQ-binding-like beta-propeller repeat protein [Methanococcoides seepicolus]|uniref:PQQ-binding-like beta-propeller repeat protein n=1 Tax=Methanococcoides seepicolus TaxID=2828780 RepID=A0A9E4ZGB7_9EURY|nr:PQQ-binding-like beta-propeller repeat protein [Methanococcoides seepicolus]MCM1987061.1 PQQ-binding-like beta-propeller repeat protein [Methanococcoides seepicolus]
MNKRMKRIIIPIVFLSLVLLISPAMAEETTSDSWHQFHKDAAHTGITTADAPDNNHILWVSPGIEAIGASSPVIADNLVFVNCDVQSLGTTNLIALDVNTGEVVWSEVIGDRAWESWASPAYNDGRVFASMGEFVTCFDAVTHEKLWEEVNPTGESSCNGGPTIADGKVFFEDWQGGYYYARNETTGELLGSFQVFQSGRQGPRAQGSPTYYDGKLYLTSVSYQYHNESGALREGYLYCVDANDLSNEIWRFDFENGLWGTASVENGIVYVATYDFYNGKGGDIYALDANTGKVLWNNENVIKSTDCTITPAYGNVYVTGGYMSKQTTYCFNGTTGELVWETDPDLAIGSWTNSAAVADGKVYAGKDVGTGGMRFGYENLFALDAYTGEIVWKGEHGGASPAISDGKVFTIDDDGKVYCYGGGVDTVDLNVLNLASTSFYNFENTVTATVANDGSSYAGDVTVSLLIDGSLMDSTTIGIGGGFSKNIDFLWTPATEGDYNITVTAETTSTDMDNSNNQRSQSLNVIDADADLVPLPFFKRVYTEQEYKIPAVIENRGYKASNPCTVRVEKVNMPTEDIVIPSIEPGESLTINFTEYVGRGNNIMNVTVDIYNETPEVKGLSGGESNNALICEGPNTNGIVFGVSPTVIPSPGIGDWEQFQQDALNNGVNANYGPSDDTPDLIWKKDDFNGPVDVVPIIANDKVYIYSSSGSLCCYGKDNGDLLWISQTEEGLLQTSTPAYGGGNVFVATRGGDLYAFNADTGEKKWKRHVSDEFFENPVTFHDHRIYIADGLGPAAGTKYVYCYDDLGNPIWKHAHYDSAGFIWAGAAVIGDYVTYPVQEGTLVSLYTANGTVADEVDLSSDVGFAVSSPGRFRGSVVYNDGYIYCTSEKGNDEGYLWKVGFDNTTGTFIDNGWSSMVGFSTSTPVIYDDKVYVGTGEHGDAGAFVCVNDIDGQQIWAFETNGGVKSSPVLSTFYPETPYIYFTAATVNGSLFCINTNGKLIWEYNPPSDDKYVLQGVALSDGKVYYGTDAGYLYCIGGDWNCWNDIPSADGQMISLNEIQNTILYWKYNTPSPGTGHVITLQDIQNMILYWKYNAPL